MLEEYFDDPLLSVLEKKLTTKQQEMLVDVISQLLEVAERDARKAAYDKE